MIDTQGSLERSKGKSPGPTSWGRGLPAPQRKRPGRVSNRSVVMLILDTII